MQIRKLQLTGGSSYIVTLPKEWINQTGVQKNDPIGIFVRSDGTLTLTSKVSGEVIQKRLKISITKNEDKDYLYRRLIGAYISGYTIVEITSKVTITPQLRLLIREFTKVAIGQEVVEESKYRIIVKDLLNPSEMPFKNTLTRMHVIAKGMHTDVMYALQTGDCDLANQIVQQDDDLDRLHWLIGRQQNLVIRNAVFANKMKTTPEMAITAEHISRILERVGDHAVRIANSVKDLKEEKDLDTICQLIKKADDIALSILDIAILSLSEEDIIAANENINTLPSLLAICEQIGEFAIELKGKPGIAVGVIAESIRRTGEYSIGISERVMNHLILLQQE